MKEFIEGLLVSLVLVISLFIVLAVFTAVANADSSTVVKDTITQTAIAQGLDPAVALAIAEVESNFNPKATGKAGEIGLFQLHPRYIKDASYSVEKNVELGVQNLLYWQKRCPTKKNKTFVNCYNRGYRPVVNPKTTPYYRKFIRAYLKHSQSAPSVASVR